MSFNSGMPKCDYLTVFKGKKFSFKVKKSRKDHFASDNDRRCNFPLCRGIARLNGIDDTN